MTLADDWGPLPALRVAGTGVGAGARDRPDRANVVRAVLGTTAAAGEPARSGDAVVLVETTVDDLDPRVWPSVVDGLLAVGAFDAWITAVLMKKGRQGTCCRCSRRRPTPPPSGTSCCAARPHWASVSTSSSARCSTAAGPTSR